jgi:hypothetical protein
MVAVITSVIGIRQFMSQARFRDLGLPSAGWSAEALHPLRLSLSEVNRGGRVPADDANSHLQHSKDLKGELGGLVLLGRCSRGTVPLGLHQGVQVVLSIC